MKLKRLKAQNGEPLIWSDYLSLHFTQSVSNYTYIGEWNDIYIYMGLKEILN